jgi:branched-chain amino acid transport system substrate-binding protein
MKKLALLLSMILFGVMVWQGMLLPDCWAQKAIKIGIPTSLTGRHAPFGNHQKRAFDLALEEINAAGGVKGRSLEWVYADDQSKPETALTAAQKLFQDKEIIMLTGEYSSSNTYPICAQAEKNKIPFLVSCAAADTITQSGWKYIFRMVQPASEFDTGLQDFLLKVAKPKSMVILHENTLFGTSTAKAMKKWADDNKIDVPIFEAYEAGLVDFRPLLFKVKAANPDALYVISYLMDATLIARQTKEIDLNLKIFAGSAAGYSIPEFLEGAGDAAELVYSSTMWERTVTFPGAKEFDEKYRKKYNILPPYHAAQAYAAAYVCWDVLKRTKKLTRDAVREALVTTNMMTIYGPITFKEYQGFKQQTQLPTLLLQVQKKKFEIVWPQDLSTAKYVFPVPKWSERK